MVILDGAGLMRTVPLLSASDVVAGVISILAKHLPQLPGKDEYTQYSRSRAVRFEQNRDQSRGNTLSSSSTWQLPSTGSSDGMLSAHASLEMDPATEALNAKIRKKLEEEMARSSKEQNVRTRTSHVIDAGGAEAYMRKDWTRSDAKMLQKFVHVFESQFGVQVNLKQKV